VHAAVNESRPSDLGQRDLQGVTGSSRPPPRAPHLASTPLFPMDIPVVDSPRNSPHGRAEMSLRARVRFRVEKRSQPGVE